MSLQEGFSKCNFSASQDGFCSVPMVQDFASLYAQEEARLMSRWKYRDSAQLTRGQYVLSKDSPRFTEIHQPPIHGRQADGCTLLQSCEFFNDVCCPGPCEDWMASQSRETQSLKDFSSLREELMDVVSYFCCWVWSWNSVMHEFIFFAGVMVECELKNWPNFQSSHPFDDGFLRRFARCWWKSNATKQVWQVADDPRLNQQKAQKNQSMTCVETWH